MTSEIFALSDSHIDKVAALSPSSATYLGIPGYDHLMNDFSPAGHDARHQLNVDTLATLNALPVTNDDDRLAAGVMREMLEAEIDS